MSPTKSDSDPSLWTLRFKNHKTTILLYAESTTPFKKLKQDLLTAFASTSVATVNGHPVPSSPAEVQFALPIDKNDLEQGWTSLEEEELLELDNEMLDGKKPGAAAKKKSTGATSPENDSPLAVGLRDGGVLAFRFKSSADDEIDSGWDVKIPTYEIEEDMPDA
ncbi:hypothetical protein MMC25_003099 [Agyrium rufum]|nr:hypothetical protein [Agyrium rufum]